MRLAKAQAAKNLIDKLDGKIPRWYMNEVRPPVVRSCYSNSVCLLNNFCIQMDFAAPRYFTPLAPGATGWQYNTICRCGRFSATGVGPSRKLARGDAAKKVISQMEARLGVSIP